VFGLAAQMLRFRKGSFVATFVALAAGVMILMTCALLVESGLRYQGQPQRYAGAVAVVAHRDITLTWQTFGETESDTVALPERGSVPDSLVGRPLDRGHAGDGGTGDRPRLGQRGTRSVPDDLRHVATIRR
jgi:putative ABC transport system permease protein